MDEKTADPLTTPSPSEQTVSKQDQNMHGRVHPEDTESYWYWTSLDWSPAAAEHCQDSSR